MCIFHFHSLVLKIHDLDPWVVSFETDLTEYSFRDFGLEKAETRHEPCMRIYKNSLLTRRNIILQQVWLLKFYEWPWGVKKAVTQSSIRFHNGADEILIYTRILVTFDCDEHEAKVFCAESL